jgi:protein ImuB
VFGSILATDSSGFRLPASGFGSRLEFGAGFGFGAGFRVRGSRFAHNEPGSDQEPRTGTGTKNSNVGPEPGSRHLEGGTAAVLHAVARDFSPRIEPVSDCEVMVDLHGLDRLIGDPPTIAGEIRRTAAERGLHVRIAIAGTRTAARLLVHAHPGLTVVEPGDERRAVAPLSIDLLRVVVEEPDLLTLRRWGLRTLGDFASLPDDEVAARLGQPGVAWQRLARGEDPRPFVPAVPEERFEQALDLEWPIDGLEPLSFVLGRLMEPLSAHLERRDRGTAVLHVRLHLVTREIHARSLQLPAPLRDARTLRTLALLDLESNPPAAAIDRVVVAVDPTPGRVVQFSLLTRPLPSPEQLSTLMARLNALMGEGRSGAPADVDSWKPGAFAMNAFAPSEPGSGIRHPASGWRTADCGLRAAADSAPRSAIAVRRFRSPVPVRVRLDEGKPSRVAVDRRGMTGGRIEACAGPWRTSGAWWDSDVWNRDEWDVTLASGETYRLFHERDSGNWFLDGVVD